MRTSNKIRSLYYDFINRFIKKYYRIDLRNVSKTAWLDLDYKLFEAMFQMFSDYILLELGESSILHWEYERKTRQPSTPAERAYEIYSWIDRKYFRRNWLQDAFAREYLAWEINLENVKTEYDSENKANKGQSANAKRVLKLWDWWTTIRPLRKEFSELVTNYNPNNMDHYINADYNADYINAFELEQKYEDEDTKMMIELCEIRRCLWT